MPNNESSHRMNIRGGQFSNVQIGQAGRDLVQTSTVGNAQEAEPTAQEVSSMLTDIEQLLKASDIEGDKKQKAIRYIAAAQAAVAEAAPDKQYVAVSLQQATKVFKEADATVSAGQGLWEKTQPLIAKILPWLGTAASFLA